MIGDDGWWMIDNIDVVVGCWCVQGYIIDEDDGCQWIMKVFDDGMLMKDDYDDRWLTRISMGLNEGSGKMPEERNMRYQMWDEWEMWDEMIMWVQRNLPASKFGPKIWLIWKTKLNPHIVGTLYCGHATK